MSTSSTVGRTVEPITAVCVILQSWHCAGLSLATQSGPTENCSNSLRLSVLASLGPQTALSSLPPLRFALPASLAYPPKPPVAWAFAGTTVHRTVVFFRLTLLRPTISPGAKSDRRRQPEGCTPGMAGIKAQGSPLCHSCDPCSKFVQFPDPVKSGNEQGAEKAFPGFFDSLLSSLRARAAPESPALPCTALAAC